MLREISGIVLVATVGAWSAGCGSGSTSQADRDRQAEEYAKSFGVDVDVKTNSDGTRSVAVDRSLGGITSQAGSNLSLPAGFPDDVPVYPGLNIASASALPGMGFLIQGQSGDAQDIVSGFYADQMKAQGWAQSGGQQTSAGSMSEFTKGNRKVTLTLFPNNGATTIQLMAMPVG